MCTSICVQRERERELVYKRCWWSICARGREPSSVGSHFYPDGNVARSIRIGNGFSLDVRNVSLSAAPLKYARVDFRNWSVLSRI